MEADGFAGCSGAASMGFALDRNDEQGSQLPAWASRGGRRGEVAIHAKIELSQLVSLSLGCCALGRLNTFCCKGQEATRAPNGVMSPVINWEHDNVLCQCFDHFLTCHALESLLLRKHLHRVLSSDEPHPLCTTLTYLPSALSPSSSPTTSLITPRFTGLSIRPAGGPAVKSTAAGPLAQWPARVQIPRRAKPPSSTGRLSTPPDSCIAGCPEGVFCLLFCQNICITRV